MGGMPRRLALLLIFPLAAGAASGVKMPASELLGREVVSAHGRPLGEVEDLVIDVREARVPYAVLAFGGWMGLGEKLYAVPTEALAVAPGKLVLNVSTAPLVNAPGFARDAWPGEHYWRGVPLPLAREQRPPLRQFLRASELVVLHVLFDYDEWPGPDRAPLRLAPQVFSFPLDGGEAVVNVARGRLAGP
jgi:sporulation protein YlmC with PRC-barrel domain